MFKNIHRRRRSALSGIVLALAALTITACSGSDSDNKQTAAEAEAAVQSDYSKPVHLVSATSTGTAAVLEDINAAFIANWKERTGQTVTIEQISGTSGAQKDAIIGSSLKADIAILGVGIDIDAIQTGGLVKEGWQQRYDFNSSPFSTAVAFVVRAGNPKGIAEWEDLLQGDAKIVTANPATDSDARWYYAAPWAYSLNRQADDTAAAKAAVASFHERVSKLAKDDAEAEGVFLGGEGDVWVTTESNALRVAGTSGKGKVEVIVPSVTLSVEPIVSAIDANADADGSREVANAYADYLFTGDAQTIAAKHGFRPRFASVAEEFADVFSSDVTLLTVDDNLTGWEDLQQALFAEDGVFAGLPSK
ncbi:sulfate ABC transporter substrate-binding protein [Cohnella terricola]|uniref:Sulfate ABC transporter substrate-binding protein n=1 Tax=Cohnella terricola TaxID=1289167 RepID=A0A559JTJ6_9BACL|nr:sulfate ABC transporter substrate-binding protein [Cohnella terricola]TVY03204.1 sulfate ABC transporter substrate-binding protein [Cohnella terricola]